jgi:radical SAM protein with 4Fe4S-binding SPASM domain
MAKTPDDPPLTVQRQAARGPEAAGRRLQVLQRDFFPAYVVWELTLACDHACTHCGSRAVVARQNELRTDQALQVVAQLAELGAREVVLIGGEAYLHDGFLTIVSALRDAGMVVVMTTGGAGITAQLARDMVRAGMSRVSVSIDGLEARHDAMRAKRGSFAQATAALRHLREVGIDVSANTNLNRTNQADLEGLYQHLKAHGVRSWQVQLTAPLGRAADHPEMLLQPYDLLQLLPRLDRLKQAGWREGLLLMPGNNLGFFGPEELRLRSQRPGDGDSFGGCQAGRFVMGIESDGAVKGCPSLPTAAYVGGRVGGSTSLRDIWERAPELHFTRGEEVALWGHCASCAFKQVCRGGCNFTAHSLLGRPGNNPYCHHRALQLRRRGLRERIVAVAAAPGDPFDHGRFALVEEPFDAPEPATPGHDLVQLRRERRARAATAASAFPASPAPPSPPSLPSPSPPAFPGPQQPAR